ncbi:hypothetical protein NVP1170O_131 [Vibrio phage 1.170.O._10N.261.52.C3]|nr:hypothetical protein NVP1170O_131 [Vibrio phage 1.170.O._10N.261.52.C3]
MSGTKIFKNKTFLSTAHSETGAIAWSVSQDKGEDWDTGSLSRNYIFKLKVMDCYNISELSVCVDSRSDHRRLELQIIRLCEYISNPDKLLKCERCFSETFLLGGDLTGFVVSGNTEDLDISFKGHSDSVSLEFFFDKSKAKMYNKRLSKLKVLKGELDSIRDAIIESGKFLQPKFYY